MTIQTENLRAINIVITYNNNKKVNAGIYRNDNKEGFLWCDLDLDMTFSLYPRIGKLIGRKKVKTISMVFEYWEKSGKQLIELFGENLKDLQDNFNGHKRDQ